MVLELELDGDARSTGESGRTLAEVAFQTRWGQAGREVDCRPTNATRKPGISMGVRISCSKGGTLLFRAGPGMSALS